jgi:hypothetical protein
MKGHAPAMPAHPAPPPVHIPPPTHSHPNPPPPAHNCLALQQRLHNMHHTLAAVRARSEAHVNGAPGPSGGLGGHAAGGQAGRLSKAEQAAGVDTVGLRQAVNHRRAGHASGGSEA